MKLSWSLLPTYRSVDHFVAYLISRPPERDNIQRRVVKAAQCHVRLVTFIVIHRAGLLKIHRENRAKVEGDFPPGVSRQA